MNRVVSGRTDTFHIPEPHGALVFRRPVVRVILQGLLLPLPLGLRGRSPVGADRVRAHLLNPLAGVHHGNGIHVAHPERVEDDGVRPDVDRVDLAAVVHACDQRRLPHHGHPREGVDVDHLSGHGGDVARSVRHLRPAEHLHVCRVAVEVQRVAPALLCVVHHVHVVPEEEHLPVTVVPPGLRREHALVLPRVGGPPESGQADVGFVLEVGCLHEDGVREHVHVIRECEELDLGVIGSLDALDELPVLVPHGSTVVEDGHAVLRVVVEVGCSQNVVVGVLQLHQDAAELGQVIVDVVDHLVARQDGPLLDDAHIAHRVDHLRVDVPQRGVAEHVGVVVHEFRRSDDLADVLSVDLKQLRRLAVVQTNEAVAVGLFLRPQKGRRKQTERDSQEYGLAERHRLSPFTRRP